MKKQISVLESSNRETLALLDSKSTAYDTLSNELSKQHQKTLELRREVTSFEQSSQSARASISAANFREQSLQHEIDSLKRSNEWLDTELKTKSAEYSKYRKDKGARIAELQHQNEDTTVTIDAMRRTEKTLRDRVEETNTKAGEYLSQIQRLQDDLTRQEEHFRIELDAANRLAELMKSSVDTERQRQQDLQAQLEKAKDDAAQEIGRVIAESETEHRDREAAERKVTELEVQVEHLEMDRSATQARRSPPGTPLPNVNGHVYGTPRREGMPSGVFSPGSARVKGGLSFTQVYSEYNNTKAELDGERRRNEKLSSTIDEMMQDMESHQPEIEELRAEHERLEADAVETSHLLETISQERDEARKEARRCEGQVKGLVRESELLRQQLRDLSSQVKVLVMEVNAQEQGLASFSVEERRLLEKLAHGDENQEMAGTETETDKFISRQLTTFRNVSELQQQNQNLLKIVRELGDRMEGEEARAKNAQAQHDQEELENIRQKYERCRDEIKSLVTQSQSYIRERDMFRRMLSHRGQLPPDSDLASLFGQSVDAPLPPATPSQNNVLQSIEHSPTSKDMADYARMLKEVTSHFDEYRREAASDRSILKSQVDELSRTTAELRGEVSRKNGEVTIAFERYDMLQANYNMLKTENLELQKRSHVSSENAAKQDIRTQQVVEDLVETKGLLDSLRNEAANLKAEKEFWKSVEKRIIDDNQNLMGDRNRLNTLNANLQNLLNEREHDDSEIRRKLQEQIGYLESEFQSVKRKLNEELEEARRASLRKEYNEQQSQTRIDDLVAGIGAVREQLAAASTARDHLQARVDDLTIELRSAEERLDVLHPRAQLKPSSGQNDEAEAEPNPRGLTHEQTLSIQISEFKRDLELARGEIETSKEQIEQYKAISQSSEEELQNLNETQDQYRQEMDKAIGQKDSKISEMEQKISLLSSEIAAAQTGLSSLRAESAQGNQKLEEQKVAFEAQVATLKDVLDRTQSASNYHQEDLKAQAEIAQQAQQNYENELVKHAEAAKTLQKVRSDYNELKVEALGLKTAADFARTAMTQNEESWSNTKDRYENEFKELIMRRDDMNAQNKLLYQQLEQVNSQVTALQRNRSEAVNEDDVGRSSDTEGSAALQEIVRYLRREKEIVDVQLELSTQEAKRSQQQLDFTQSQLNEVRLKLNQQRRAEEDNERNALNYEKLMATINELNLNRESNATLRREKEQAHSALTERSRQVEELTSQIQPLQAKIGELEDALEANVEDLRMTREARERFEQRYHDLLNKTDSIDPAEFDSLREQVNTLTTERNESLAVKGSMQEQIDSIPDQIKKAQDEISVGQEERRFKMIEQFKARSKDLSGKIKDKDEALRLAANEKVELEVQLKNVQGNLDNSKAELERLNASRRPEELQIAGEKAPNGSEDGQVEDVLEAGSTEADTKVLMEKIQAATVRADASEAHAMGLQDQLSASQARVAELEQQINDLQQTVKEANNRISDLEIEKARQRPAQSDAVLSNQDDQELARLLSELAKAKEDNESLRTTAAVNASIGAVQPEGEPKTVADQISEQVVAIRAELQARHNERTQALEATYKQRSENMKNQLSQKLKEGKVGIKESLNAEHTQAIEALNAKHAEEIRALEIRHQEELDELKRNEETRFEQFKAVWHTMHPTANGEESSATDQQPAQQTQSVMQATKVKWEPSDAEINSLISENLHVKKLLANNLRTKLDKERESLQAQFREAQEKAIAEKVTEAEAKASNAREKAVELAEKRLGVKTNMAENRARMAMVKIDIVQKAANDTPQKPVVEVWAIAKDAKPPPTPLQSAHQPSQIVIQASLQPSSFGKPTPAAQGTFGQPTPVQVPNSGLRQLQPRPSVADNSGDHTANVQASQSQASSSPTQVPQAPTSITTTQQNQKIQRTNTGTGPGALKSLQSVHSGIPTSAGRGAPGQRVPTQPSLLPGPSQGQRGGLQSVHARGGARGNRGRGGMGSVQTGQLPTLAPAQASPNNTVGGMNVGAKQFVPQGNKRTREDGQEIGQEGNGKRLRAAEDTDT